MIAKGSCLTIIWYKVGFCMGFLGSSAGKESTCNAEDPSSIPGLGRSPGEGIGSPFQYSWTFLLAQRVKNLPAMRETWVQPLGWEDALEEGMATHRSILAWRIPMHRGAWRATVHGVAEPDMTEWHSTAQCRVLHNLHRLSDTSPVNPFTSFIHAFCICYCLGTLRGKSEENGEDTGRQKQLMITK